MRRHFFFVLSVCFCFMGLVTATDCQAVKNDIGAKKCMKNLGANVFAAAVTAKLNNVDRKLKLRPIKRFGIHNKNYNKNINGPKNISNIKSFQQHGGW